MSFPSCRPSILATTTDLIHRRHSTHTCTQTTFNGYHTPSFSTMDLPTEPTPLVDPITNRARYNTPKIKRNPVTGRYDPQPVADAFTQVKKILASEVARPAVRAFPSARDLFLACVPKAEEEDTTDLRAAMSLVLKTQILRRRTRQRSGRRFFSASLRSTGMPLGPAHG